MSNIKPGEEIMSLSFRDELRAALVDPAAEAIVAEGLAAGELIVVNRHSVSPGVSAGSRSGTSATGTAAAGRWGRDAWR